MADATERIVNLALFIAGSVEPVTAAQCRSVDGYPPGQDDVAFAQMFERDKKMLREAGLVLEVVRTDEVESYRLDPTATFSAPLELTPSEVVLLRSAGASMLADPAFPYAADLRFALAKVLRGEPEMPALPLSALSADEDPERQADIVADLTAAVSARKRAAFTYTNVRDVTARRDVEPYGLFLRDGRWYLVARDTPADTIKVFAVTRMTGLSVDTSKLRHPDFERPADFRVESWMLIPFQYGAPRYEATVVFTGPAAPRAATLAAGRGVLEPQADGRTVWRVPVSSEDLFLTWVVEHGPGVEIVEPASARDALRAGIERVVSAHAG